MTIQEFCNLIRSNIDLFERDYLAKHEKFGKDGDSYPLESVYDVWMQDFDIWLRLIEQLGDMKSQYIAVPLDEEEEDSGDLVMDLEGFE